MRRLSGWLPQSLFARLLAALVAVAGITLIVIVLLILRERRDLALWGSSAWSAAAVIAETSQQLAALDHRARHAAVEKFRAEPIEIESTRRGVPPQVERAIEESKQAFLRRLRHQLDADYTVSIGESAGRDQPPIRVIEERGASDREGAGAGDARAPASTQGTQVDREVRRPRLGRGRPFDIEVTLPDGERLLFRTNIPILGSALPKQIFGELAALTLALALVLFLMTRNIVKPLAELASAADAIGKGAKVAALPERGARELRDATRAFNTMQDRLHRYLDSRTRVLVAMSHDLRTPLTRMRLRAETIDDADTRERITADLDEMSVMVTGALALFKGLNDSEAAVPLLIDDVLIALRKEFTELGGDVVLNGKSDGPILVKPNAIKRCLSNLLHNAVKYGERARVEIAPAGAQLQIRIRDDGPGIPEELLQQVFEPFYRVESSRNRDSGGTGLGLCIARDIAEAHGGSIQLRNVPTGGLEAVLSLPIKA
jgi:signal transduction histidine kinase